MRFFEAKAHGLHDMGNPLFPRKEKATKLWSVVAALMLLAVVIAAAAALVYGPYLRITTVEVSGTLTLSSEDIRNKVKEQFSMSNFLILPNGHQWFFDARSAEVMLQKNFPLKTVSIQQEGKVLKVEIVEDIFMVAFRSGEEVYILERNGSVIRVAEPSEKAAVLVKIKAVDAPAEGEGGLATIQADMPVIRSKTEATYVPGDQLFSEDMIINIIAFTEGLREMGMPVYEFVSDDPQLPWFTVTSDKDYVILFDATEDVDTQLTVLKTVTDEYFATQESWPRYIDVRFGTRVYVR